MHKYEKRLTVKAEGEKASRVRLVMLIVSNVSDSKSVNTMYNTHRNSKLKVFRFMMRQEKLLN